MRALAIAASLALSVGCAGPKSAPRAPTPIVAERPGVLGHVPAAGLEWLAFVRPAAIEKREDIASLIKEIATEERLAAFEATVGIDLEKVRGLAVASFGPGTLYVADLGAPSAPLAREQFADRLDGGGLSRKTKANVHRVFGTIHGEPVAMVSVDDDFVAVAKNDTSLARIVEAYSAHRLRSPTALHGVALRGLPGPPADALAAFYAAYPFGEDAERAASGLLRKASAASLVARGGAPGVLELTLSLAGDFAPSPERAAADVARAWQELCSTSFGTLLALDQASTPEINSDLHLLTLSTRMPLRPLVRVIAATIDGDVHEIFDVVPSPPAPAPADPR